MEILDWLIFSAFVAYALLSGWRSRKISSENLEEYFLAGRSLNGWQAGFSMAATQFAADTPLLVTGLVATRGMFSLWQLWVFVFAFFLFSYLIASNWRSAGVITDAEFTQKRYRESMAFTLRMLKAFYFGILFNCLVLAWVLLAATKISEPYLLWNQWLPSDFYQPLLSMVTSFDLTFATGEIADKAQSFILTTNNILSITAILVVTLFYSTLGGLRAVVRTDVVQLAIMFLATIVFVFFLVDHLGGMGPMLAQLKSLYPADGSGSIDYKKILAFDWSHSNDVGWTFFMLISLQWLIQVNADGTGYLAQRAMACKNDREARKAGVIFSVTQILCRSLLWLPIAVGLMVLFPLDLGSEVANLNMVREKTYILGMNAVLPIGFLGLMFTALFAALTSTVDSHLNWGASYLTNDLIKELLGRRILKIEISPRALVWLARLSNLVILLIAVIFCSHLDSIQEAWQISLMLGSGVGIVLVLRWFWWRISALSEVAAIAASFCFSLLAYNFIDDAFLRIVVVAFASTTVALLCTLLPRRESEEVLVKFFSQVKPAGFWPPHITGSQQETHRSRSRLARGLKATFFSGFSLCFLLSGFGGLLLSSPSPRFLEIDSMVWNLMLILAGLVFIWPGYVFGFKGTVGDPAYGRFEKPN